MNILHVAPSYFPAVRYGGPIASVHGLCKALAARGHNVEVMTTSIDGVADSEVPLAVPVDRDGVKVWYFQSKHLRRLYWAPPMARALSARLSQCDIAHLHSIFLWPTWAAARTARRSAIPYVLAPRGMLEKRLISKKSRLAKSAWIALIERRNVEQAAAIHVTSRREADEAEAFGFALPPLVEVPNGIDLDESTSRVPPSHAIATVIGRGRFLLFLGRITWKKGLDRLVAALPHVPGVNLVVAGHDDEGYRRTVAAQARDYGVLDRVLFTAPVSGADKAALLTHAQALVLPSYSENFGNVVLEAMAARCPVVVTREVGSSTIVEQTGSGRILPGDAPALGSGLAALLSDSDSLLSMGKRGRAAVEQHYSWKSVAERMEIVYREATARSARLARGDSRK